MCNFVEDYFQNPTQTISAAKKLADEKFNRIQIDEDLIYAQLSSPEFRLYEAILLSSEL